MSDGMKFETAIPAALLPSIQAGTMGYTYKGIPTWKCPLDIAIYTQLLWDLKPGTIIEFGSNRGGSAIMLADQLAGMGLAGTRVLSFDINPVTELTHPMVSFGYADLARPAECLDAAALRQLPKPLLVIDDASHMAEHVLATLRFMDGVLAAGDYLIVEDGILTHFGWSEQYGGGPLEALKTFLAETAGRYVVDRARCDTFGSNVTWNIDGYLRCVK